MVAPAGYGKTTLVTTWLHQLSDVHLLWLSLDEADNDVHRFFTYLVAALSKHDSAIEPIANVGSAQLLISWAEVLRARNQLTEAADYLVPAIEALKPLRSMAVVVQTGAIALAYIYQVQGEGAEALALLRDILQDFRAHEHYYPAARVSATVTQLHLQQGNLIAAKTWVEKSGLHATDDPTYLLEIDYLVLARVFIADGDAPAAQTLLGKLANAAVAGGRMARLIETHILQALAHQALNEPEQALDHLTKAIDLAQPEGFVRLFIDEGKALAPLLKQIAARGVAVDYIRQLLPLFDKRIETQMPTSTASTTISTAIDAEANALDLLLNPLTDRELDTLRYLTSDLTVPQIAEQMIVAPSTVRS